MDYLPVRYAREVFSGAWVIAGTTVMGLVSLWGIIVASPIPVWLLPIGFAAVFVVAGYRPWRHAIVRIAELDDEIVLLRRRAAICGFNTVIVVIINAVENDGKTPVVDTGSVREDWLRLVRELAGASAEKVIEDSEAALREGDVNAVVRIAQPLISLLKNRDRRLASAFLAGFHAGGAMMGIPCELPGSAPLSERERLSELSDNARKAGLSAKNTRQIVKLLKKRPHNVVSQVTDIVENRW